MSVYADQLSGFSRTIGQCGVRSTIVAQNVYDDPDFFAGYSALPRSVQGLDGAPEWPSLQALLPDLAGREVVDLGCGFGWFSRWLRRPALPTCSASTCRTTCSPVPGRRPPTHGSPTGNRTSITWSCHPLGSTSRTAH
jgi:hypothetical protein